MDADYVGIDVSKDRLHMHARPCGEALAVASNGHGLSQLADRLQALAPTLIAVEATGGFEAVVAANLASAGLSVAVVNSDLADRVESAGEWRLIIRDCCLNGAVSGQVIRMTAQPSPRQARMAAEIRN